MNYKSYFAFFTAILTSLSCLSQSTPTAVTEDFRPASTNQQGKQYPQVNSDRQSTCQFHCAGGTKSSA